MKRNNKVVIASLLAIIIISTLLNAKKVATIKYYCLYINGTRSFLKIAVPLYGFVADEISVLKTVADSLKAKNYNTIKLNIYWHYFDTDGDGLLERTPYKVNSLIRYADSIGLNVAVSFETYNVGGGGTPDTLFLNYPEVQAYNSNLQPAVDTEYGSQKKIPSIFSIKYNSASRLFIKNFISGIDASKVLYWETTVEPQYIGNQHLDYSENARVAYQAYCTANSLTYSWPPATTNAQWNRFRAISIADWIDGDANAIKEAAGDSSIIAVDYLEVGDASMVNRLGDSHIFLQNLDEADVIQCNWHYLFWGNNTPYDLTYNNANQYKQQKGWAISEHMTISGTASSSASISSVLEHTLSNNNKFGWECVNAKPISDNTFCIYNDDWSAKWTGLREFDNTFPGYWQARGLRISLTPAEYNAEISGATVPTSMIPGGTYTIPVQVKNTGTAMWQGGVQTDNGKGRINLGSQEPENNTRWGTGRFRLATGTNVASGATTVINCGVTAPSTPGTYTFAVKMMAEFITWFGNVKSYTVNVSPQSSINYHAPDKVMDEEESLDFSVTRAGNSRLLIRGIRSKSFISLYSLRGALLDKITLNSINEKGTNEIILDIDRYIGGKAMSGAIVIKAGSEGKVIFSDIMILK